MKEQDITLSQKLPQFGVDLLMEELGVAGYLQKTQCQRQGYSPDGHGWNKTGNHCFYWTTFMISKQIYVNHLQHFN